MSFSTVTDARHHYELMMAMKRRHKKALLSFSLSQMEPMVEALRKLAIEIEYDYPSETPAACGRICNLCGATNEELDGDFEHGDTCVLAHYEHLKEQVKL